MKETTLRKALAIIGRRGGLANKQQLKAITTRWQRYREAKAKGDLEAVRRLGRTNQKKSPVVACPASPELVKAVTSLSQPAKDAMTEQVSILTIDT